MKQIGVTRFTDDTYKQNKLWKEIKNTMDVFMDLIVKFR